MTSDHTFLVTLQCTISSEAGVLISKVVGVEKSFKSELAIAVSFFIVQSVCVCT